MKFRTFLHRFLPVSRQLIKLERRICDVIHKPILETLHEYLRIPIYIYIYIHLAYYSVIYIASPAPTKLSMHVASYTIATFRQFKDVCMCNMVRSLYIITISEHMQRNAHTVDYMYMH